MNESLENTLSKAVEKAMTAKEKAKGLVGRFTSRIKIDEIDGRCSPHRVNYESIECALICVDEILKEGATQYGATAVEYGREKYWIEVKSEIEKL